MELERSAIAVIAVLAAFAFFIAGTADLTGNFAGDVGAAANPVLGLAALMVFVIAIVLVLRVFVPEGGSK